MIGRTVVFTHDDVVGDDVVESAVSVEPLVAIEGDPARPAIPLRHARSHRHVPVMVDDVVISRKVITLPGADPRPSGMAHRVFDKTQVMSALTEEGVTGVAPAIEIEPAKF